MVILELDSFAKREAALASKTLAANAASGTGSQVGQEDVVMTPQEEVTVVTPYPEVPVALKVSLLRHCSCLLLMLFLASQEDRKVACDR